MDLIKTRYSLPYKRPEHALEDAIIPLRGINTLSIGDQEEITLDQILPVLSAFI